MLQKKMKKKPWVLTTFDRALQVSLTFAGTQGVSYRTLFLEPAGSVINITIMLNIQII